MTAIIFISIAIGCIPAIIVYHAWNKWVFHAFTLPAMMDAYIRIMADLSNAMHQLSLASQKFAKSLPSGGVISTNTDNP
jgi:hypothetical protein